VLRCCCQPDLVSSLLGDLQRVHSNWQGWGWGWVGSAAGKRERTAVCEICTYLSLSGGRTPVCLASERDARAVYVRIASLPARLFSPKGQSNQWPQRYCDGDGQPNPIKEHFPQAHVRDLHPADGPLRTRQS
jgi:hypothetical protein